MQSKKSHVPIIARCLIKKPNLGGWRDVRTGIEYRNGDTQTGPATKRVPSENTCSRKLQTSYVANKECQGTISRACQMSRRDCYVSSVNDVYASSRDFYATFDDTRTTFDFDDRARIIQRCYRAYKFLKKIKACAERYRLLSAECERLRDIKRLERRKRHESDRRDLNDPSSPSGFAHLLSLLEAEDSYLPIQHQRPRVRALRLLAERQRVYLANCRLSRAYRETRERDARVKFLRRCCAPRRWHDRKNDRYVEMLSLKNQAALECFDLYEKLERIGDEGRKEILVKARCSVEKHYCREADVFRELIDQEIVLTSKDVDRRKLEFLGKRIVGAYLNFLRNSHDCACRDTSDDNCRSHVTNCCDYEFRESPPPKVGLIFCPSCAKLRPRSRFPATTRQQLFNRCAACTHQHANSTTPQNKKPIAELLRRIRRSEPNGVADVLSVADLRYLVFNVWHGRSLLSEIDDLIDLRLPRYRPDRPWSPWNCILLTEDEAEAHYHLDGDEKYYADHFARKIKAAHRTAIIVFRDLVEFAKRLKNVPNDVDVESKRSQEVTMVARKSMKNIADDCDCKNRGVVSCRGCKA